MSNRVNCSSRYSLSEQLTKAAEHQKFRALAKVEPVTGRPMPDKNYLVRFTNSNLAPQLVRAATVQIHGEHLVFLLSDGKLSALFLFEIVEDWSEIDI